MTQQLPEGASFDTTLPKPRAWTCQVSTWRAIECNEEAVASWGKETWSRVETLHARAGTRLALEDEAASQYE